MSGPSWGQRPSWFSHVLQPERLLPKAIQPWTPAGILGQVDQATGLRSKRLMPDPAPHVMAAIYHAAAQRGMPLPPSALQFLAQYHRQTAPRGRIQ